MTETTTEEQIDIWKKELATAVADEQWRLALKLCSWLRYALSQQGLSDPKVEKAHQQAKERLAEQVAGEKTQQEREREREMNRRRMQQQIMHQIISGKWEQVLDSIEEFYRDRVERQDAIHLLQELKARTARMLSPQYRQMDRQAAALGKRFDEVVERVGASLLLSGNRMRDESHRLSSVSRVQHCRGVPRHCRPHFADGRIKRRGV